MGIRLLAVGALAAITALSIAACGGSNGSSESATTSSTAGSTSVRSPSESEPTMIPKGLTPLPEPPPKGVKVLNLQCDFPTCETYSEIFQEAADALGWDVRTSVFKTGQPQSALTQAVNTPGVEYITISGTPQSIVEPQIKQAEEKGIQIISCCDTAAPQPPAWPIQISNTYGNSVYPATQLARWMINDSSGKANVAVLSLPEIPIVTPIAPAIEATLEKECDECSGAEIAVTGEELAAGGAPSKVVAYLQGHPEVSYLAVAFGNLLNGVPQAIKSAGLSEKVKIVSMSGIETPESEMLKNGEVAAYYVAGLGEIGTAPSACGRTP